MKRPTLLFLFALLSCAPATPRPVAVATPRPSLANGTAQRVVVMSFDGLGADALARQPLLPAFERLAREGASARVIPVNPTLTAPAHAALLTGADPQKSGIVANRFHRPGTPPDEETRGMMTDPDVESLVEAARRQGKRVGAVPFPTIDARSPRRTADFGLTWSEPVVRGRTITLARQDFKREWVPPGWTAPPARRQSYSPVLRARLEWGIGDQTCPDGQSCPPSTGRVDIDLVAYDSTDDRVENYDALYLESGDFETAPDARGWFPVSTRSGDGLHGSWSKLLRADPALGKVEVYWGAISSSQAYPQAFRDLVEEEAGFWPGAPDDRADPVTFSEQLVRLSEYLTKVQTAAIRRMSFDLLLVYQPVIDEASHIHLGRNDQVVRDAFAASDRAIDAVSRALDPARDALVLTGDHGLMAADREVRMNRLLADGGFAPRWRAFASGSVAHIYGDGDPAAVVAMLQATGHFEKVTRRGSGHRNTGDVVAIGFPNVALTGSSETPAVRPRSTGQHGASNEHRELHTVLLAIGPGVPKGPLGEVAQTRIARFVSALLGIQPPAAAE